MKYIINIKVDKSDTITNYYKVSIFINNIKLYKYELDDVGSYINQLYSRDNINSPTFESMAKSFLHEYIFQDREFKIINK